MNSGEQVSNSNSSTNSNSDQAGGRGGGDNTQAQGWKPRFPLSVLTEGDRVERILRHRIEFSGFGASALRSPHYAAVTPQSDGIPTSITRLPPFFQKLRPLKLRNMDPDECSYHHGRLDLELIEDPQEFTRVMMLGQDKDGDVTNIALYCEPAVLKQCFSLSKIGFGCKISIANPLYKIALDGRAMVRVDEEEDIFFWDGKDDKKCRFCSKLGAQHKCGRCKKAFYCSKECQTHDWKVMKHKKVCDVYRISIVNQY